MTGQHLFGLGSPRVVAYHHLEPVAAEGLGGQRVEQPAQAKRALVGGHDHGYLRARHKQIISAWWQAATEGRAPRRPR